MNNKEIEKFIKEHNKEDVNYMIDPLYSIKNGSWYANEEMYRDIEELLVATGIVSAKKAMKKQKKDILVIIYSMVAKSVDMKISSAILINKIKELKYE